MEWAIHRYGVIERHYAESDDREYNIDVDSDNLIFSWDGESGYNSVDIPIGIVAELLCRNEIMQSMIDYYVVYQVMSS